MLPSIRYYGKSDVGLIRAHNEDAFNIDAELGYCLVADGLGGAAAGDLASHIFSETTKSVFQHLKIRSEKEIIERVQNVFRLANENIIDHTRKNPSHRGMGCTAELMAFSDDRFVLGHVGDSRTYRLRKGILKQLTQDHSLVQDRVNKGVLSKEDARKHPLRNIVLQAVGVNRQIALDLVRGKMHPEDQFLLCSDGLTDMVEDTLIQTTLSTNMTLEQKSDHLLEMALTAGGIDNITVVLVKIHDH